MDGLGAGGATGHAVLGQPTVLGEPIADGAIDRPPEKNRDMQRGRWEGGTHDDLQSRIDASALAPVAARRDTPAVAAPRARATLRNPRA